MSVYRIQASKEPSWESLEIIQDLQLTDEQLKGMVAAATAIFDENRDNLFAIFDQSGQRVDLEKILQESNVIVFEGEPAFDLNPEYDQWRNEKSWMDTIAKEARFHNIDKYVSKPYTVKAGGADGNYLFQFEGDGFYSGMVGLINLLGLSPSDVLVYLHLGDNPLQV